MRALVLAFVAAVAVASTAVAHLDHPAPMFAPPGEPPSSSGLNAGGPNASWELLATVFTGNPHSDLDFFTQKGETYASVGTLGVGPNAGGQSIIQLTDKGTVAPHYVAAHPSAACTGSSSATGLQHDVEATPKGDTILNAPNQYAVKQDAQLLLDSSDAGGRCHDQGVFGLSAAPPGGIEVIDITDVTKPKELVLISHIGQAHTVNVDPKRPHIAFDITQDGVSLNAEGKRSNETSGNALDGFELIDLSSCMNFPAGTTVDAKRNACRPQVYRYRYPTPDIALSHTYRTALQSCHEVEIYADDTLACSSITATALFDLAGAFDDNGTPTDYSDDTPKGTPLPCRVRDSSTAAAFTTGAKVLDCVNGQVNDKPQPLTVSEWLKIGAPSLEGVKWVGTVPHMGFGATADIANTPYDAPRDILAAHESELTGSRKFVLTTDERGGGVVPGGASCSPGADNARGNGGIHAFPIGSFTTNPPKTAEDAWKLWAKTSKGEPAVYRAPVRTGPQGAFCTAHVFQQIPGQNRIFMGWYSQGTQVVDFTENADGTIDFKEAAWFTPEQANTWTSAIFRIEQNPDGTFTYYGATGDGIIEGAGRSAIDVYKVTLPPPPKPLGPPQAGTPTFPPAPAAPASPVTGGSQTCRTATIRSARVRQRGRNLRFTLRTSRSAKVAVQLQDARTGRRVASLGRRTGSFSWRGHRRLRDGFYVARFATGKEVRRIALRRRGGRWRMLPAFERQAPCDLLLRHALSRPVFGGRAGKTLSMTFRLAAPAKVGVTVRRGGKVVRRYKRRDYAAGTTHRLRLPAVGLRRGTYRITLDAVRPERRVNSTLQARRL